MWFLNKKTNIKWQVTDKELITRLSNNKDFKIVKKEVIKTEESSESDYSSLPFAELKSIASEKGINTHKMKKQDIIQALNERQV